MTGILRLDKEEFPLSIKSFTADQPLSSLVKTTSQ